MRGYFPCFDKLKILIGIWLTLCYQVAHENIFQQYQLWYFAKLWAELASDAVGLFIAMIVDETIDTIDNTIDTIDTIDTINH